MNRRQFVTELSSAVLAPSALGAAAPMLSCATQRETGTLDFPLGLQLYTIRSVMEEGVREALDVVAQIGFVEVEFAGYFGNTAEEIGDLLVESGLRSPASHVSLSVMRNDLASTLDIARIAGHQLVIVPFLPGEVRSEPGYRQVADEFNDYGAACQEVGLAFGYHNHDFEFEQFGDVNGLDLLLDNTDPELVAFELDFFWMSRGGADPVAYMNRHPGRFQLGHLKDIDDDGAMVDVGQGALDFVTLIGEGQRLGMKHFFVEHDRPADPLESIRNSHRFLSGVSA